MFKKHRKKIIAAVLVILLAAGVWLLWRDAYGTSSPSKVTLAVEKVLPLPAAVINGRHFVTLKDLRRNLAATRQFYEGQDFASIGVRIDFTTEEGKKKLKLWERTILDKLIEDKVVSLLAEEKGIKITDAQARARVNQELKRLGRGSVVRDNIKRLWGFDIEDFSRFVVKPQLYRERLAKIAAKEQDLTSLKQRILEAKSALDQGMDFAVVARQYSDAPDAASEKAGAAKWFAAEELAEPVLEAVSAVPAGSYTDVIETENGFNVVWVKEKKQEDGGELYLLKNIIVYKPTFADWLDEQIRRFSIKVPLADYYWNEKTAHVAFAEGELRDFAEEVAENGIE
ncbi:MAG TPA: hypothetical protein ENJ77_01805 [Candidatus Moranbacteria bacterium]|nr:hypothetical protein [Candidatus Moranbacteria bacterium]